MSELTHEAPGPLRVLVVDSDERIRESLSRLLPIGGRVVVVGAADRPDRALELAESTVPDVVLVDCRVAGLSAGPGFADRLRTAAPDARIVVLTLPDTNDGPTALPGADAYIRKTFRPQELIDAVVNAARNTVA
jgi:DNA-binding NarL/FixJ family response regulator